MNLSLLIHTVRYIKPIQLFGQIFKRINRVTIKTDKEKSGISFVLKVNPIIKPNSLINNSFCFINIKSNFESWNDNRHGALWRYNLNYMDWLQQADIDRDICIEWIDKFISDSKTNRIGFEPYPTALRSVNWIKFFILNPECRSKIRDGFLYSQIVLLSKNIEYHLLGNHIIEDLYSIYIGSLYFQDYSLNRKSKRILKKELEEQILPDGAHFEQSAMYHSIILERLLDCINFSLSAPFNDPDNIFIDFLRSKAKIMLGNLENILWKDGSIPLINDAAYGIASSPEEILLYAKRLGLSWYPLPLKECGLRHISFYNKEVLIDVADICATYQPGHSHADTFTYEMRIDGVPFIIDTGTSTYNKNELRDYERSTAAHNTVSVEGRNSSDTWSGFRIGKRAKVKIIADSNNHIEAVHQGFGKKCKHYRAFRVKDSKFIIEDTIECNKKSISYIHFAPNVKITSYSKELIETNRAKIFLSGAISISIIKGYSATEFNRLREIQIALIEFKSHLTHIIE
ncbi:MAG TPA: alginate lyase family protein [Bacteroidaceae bacterium]|nr:alginate lyase family protein [Bacteroidaceae bacterium]